MGKGTDKLYVTHSEWADDSFNVGAGSGAKSKAAGASFRRLPFNFCAISLQPFKHPVCTANGIIFDLTQILPWVKKHGTNPVDGTPLKSQDLIKLNFVKNEDGEYVDPVSYKPLTDNTHIISLRNTGNVFAWETIERLNIKAKNWKDLVSDADFLRKDIITLQDPQNLESRDLSAFEYLKDGVSTLTPEPQKERADPTSNLNLDSMGNAAKILKAKEALAKSRAERSAGNVRTGTSGNDLAVVGPKTSQSDAAARNSMAPTKAAPYNAALHTTGKAAASFTSTGVSVHTGNELALLSEEEYLLKPRRVKQKGYARIQTNLGDLNVELQTEYAPRAVWNFIQLSKRGYYKNVSFHRNIRNFMLQGGDPTGTGRGGQSVWGKPFKDEYAQSGLTHDSRGVISMANKGKDTNTSQFFITYRATKHLDRKHTIFGRLIDNDAGGESQQTLSKLENVKTENDKPVDECFIEDIVVFVDPFEEFQKASRNGEAGKDNDGSEAAQEKAEDESTTWTGKRVRPDGRVVEGEGDVGIGKYLATATAETLQKDDDVIEFTEEWEEKTAEPPAKKRKAKGGFGNFAGW